MIFIEQEFSMYGMPNLIGLFVFILLLVGIEAGIRKKWAFGTLKNTPAQKIHRIEWITKGILLFCAIPLLHYITLFFFVFAATAYIPSTLTTLMLAKWISFVFWSILMLAKAFMERKYVNTKSAVLTLSFGIPVIVLLFSIYTFTF